MFFGKRLGLLNSRGKLSNFCNGGDFFCFSTKSGHNPKLQQLIDQRFLSRDHLIRCHVGNLRISAVSARHTLATFQDKWKLSTDSRKNRKTEIFGDLMLGTAMLSSFYKGEERIKATLRNSEVKEAYVEAICLGEIRGFVDMDGGETISDSEKSGSLHISKVLYGERTPFDSVVSGSSDICQTWQEFYDTSEQIDTLVNIKTVLDEKSGDPLICCGVTIQKMPPSSMNPADESISNRIYSLEDIKQEPDMADTIAKYGILEYLNTIIPDANLTLGDCKKVPIDFFCRCSKTNFLNKAMMYNRDHLQAIADEDGEATITCHFCNENHVISKQDICSAIE